MLRDQSKCAFRRSWVLRGRDDLLPDVAVGTMPDGRTTHSGTTASADRGEGPRLWVLVLVRLSREPGVPVAGEPAAVRVLSARCFRSAQAPGCPRAPPSAHPHTPRSRSDQGAARVGATGVAEQGQGSFSRRVLHLDPYACPASRTSPPVGQFQGVAVVYEFVAAWCDWAARCNDVSAVGAGIDLPYLQVAWVLRSRALRGVV